MLGGLRHRALLFILKKGGVSALEFSACLGFMPPQTPNNMRRGCLPLILSFSEEDQDLGSETYQLVNRKFVGFYSSA